MHGSEVELSAQLVSINLPAVALAKDKSSQRAFGSFWGTVLIFPTCWEVPCQL